MKTRFVVWTVVLVAFIVLLLSLWRLQHTPRRLGVITNKDITAALARLRGTNGVPAPATITPIDLNRPLRLAIGSLGREDDEQNRQLEDLVLADLTGAPGLELVERQSLDKVLQELNLSISHLVRAQDAVRAGKLLKADWFLLGTKASINGTNFIVVRLVDSRTGIMREADVFSTDGSQVKLAADIAGFVQQCRQDAAHPKPKVYLAIGTFEDFSLNNRQAAFPTQLRAYLTAAYQKSGVTLLEREAADVLYREMQLDLAGLTGGGGTNPPELFQSAYWLVDGDYQSYETTNFEVEVALRVNRMFGRISRETLRGPPDRRLFAMIKNAIDEKMRQDGGALPLSIASEAKRQMSAGKELAGGEVIYLSGYEELDQQEFARRRRNAEEAIRAFETVLLLQPTNREAMMRLAACFRNQTIARVNDARNLYREILEEPVRDNWTGAAEQALEDSFLYSDPSEKARWFAASIGHNTNSALEEFYRRNAESASRDATIENGGPDAVKEAEKRVVDRILSYKNVLAGKPGVYYGEFGLDEFFGAFGNKADAAKAMAAFLPKLESEFPELAPHLTAVALSFQVDTNSSVVREYQKQLEWCLSQTNKFYHPEIFWGSAKGAACDWLFAHHLNALAIETMDGYRAALGQKLSDVDKMTLAFNYMKVERWNSALELFESYSNMPVMMPNRGPWGSGEAVVLTEHWADDCRAKLELPIVRDSREFVMGKTSVALCDCSTFALDETGVWGASGDQLLHLDQALKTNLVFLLPKDADTPITTLDVGTDKIWIGTEGDGLIEFDKASRQCNRLTVANGLMMNEICSTCLANDALWIGYGHKGDFAYWGDGQGDAGGIGYLNLSNHQVVSFSPSLAKGVDAIAHVNDVRYEQPVDQPPRRAVLAIAADHSGDIWFTTRGGNLRRFQRRSNTWEAIPQVSSGLCLAARGDQLYAGQFRGMSGDIQGDLFGLKAFDFNNGEWRDFKAVEGLPRFAVSALATDGNDLWVGGVGYLVWLDPKQNAIKTFAYIPALHFDKIQVGEGYVWAQGGGYLYRSPLAVAENLDVASNRNSQFAFLQSHFAKFVPFQFQKNVNGVAILQRLPVHEGMIERDGMYYCGFKFTIPAWADGNLKLMYILAKTESNEDFIANYMVSQIISENGPPVGSYGNFRESLSNYPQLKAQFPYTTTLTTQIFDIKRLEPGKTYGIWFEFDSPNLPDIDFAMTINSPRGTNELGRLPLR